MATKTSEWDSSEGMPDVPRKTATDVISVTGISAIAVSVIETLTAIAEIVIAIATTGEENTIQYEPVQSDTCYFFLLP